MSPRTFLALDLDAPLMAMGGPRLDGRPQGYRIPTKAMITGLVANAAGVDRTDIGYLQALQDGLGMACAVLRPGEEMVDYQTADLTTPHMGGVDNRSWSPSGKVFRRAGGTETKSGRRQQWRPYVANAHVMVVLWQVGELPISLEAAAAALDEPARFLFLGRKCCPPGGPISMGLLEADTPAEALSQAAGTLRIAEFVLPLDVANPPTGNWSIERVSGERNWTVDRHTGTQLMARVAALPKTVEMVK